jgi:hypothetical protein
MPARKVKDDLVIDVNFINNNPDATYEEVLQNRIPVEIFEGFDMNSYHSIEAPKGGGGFQANTTIGDTTKFIIGNTRTASAEIRVTGSLADSGLRIYWNRSEGHLKTFGEPLRIQPDKGDLYIGNKLGSFTISFGRRTFEVKVVTDGFNSTEYIEFDDRENRQRARITLVDY